MHHPIAFDPPIDGGVVAGFDGSGPGRRALAWAWREALAHDLPLHVVRAWTLSGTIPEVGAPPGIVPSLDECAATVLADTRRVLDRIRRQSDGKEPPTYLHMVHGHPNEVMQAAVKHADVVVVGHRGHNLLTMVLGSVATHVLEHARCPVVVLPVP